MVISELIDSLQKFKEQHGDCIVVAEQYGYHGWQTPDTLKYEAISDGKHVLQIYCVLDGI